MFKKDAVDGSRYENRVTVRQNQMASVELLYIDKEGRRPCPLDRDASTPPHGRQPGEALSGDRGCGCEQLMGSAPQMAPARGVASAGRGCHVDEQHARVCCDHELETSFTYVDENVNLRLVSPTASGWKGARVHKPALNGGSVGNAAPEAALPELSLLSDEDLFSENAASVDYGFISAVTFLVTGISLVVVSYAVPRQVQVDPESVSAREMERLEAESARVGAHLDRCVIAGLCLLTLGGVVLSSLLMLSLWKGEMYRRRAFACSKRSGALYGSTHLRTRSSPSHSSAHLSLEELEEETVN